MNTLSWNCRRLGKPDAIEALRLLIHHHKPDIVFTSELKFSSPSSLSNVSTAINFQNSYFVPAQSLSGVLALFWFSSIDFLVVAANSHFINAWFLLIFWIPLRNSPVCMVLPWQLVDGLCLISY